MDALADAGVGLKMRLLLLTVGLVPALAGLLALHQAGPAPVRSALALYVAAFVLLFYPLSRLLEELVVLRQTRRINEFVDGVKGGCRTVDFDLPEERGEEHDFLRLKRNIFWMVDGLRRREHEVRDTLARLAEAQRQVLESIEYAGLIQRSFLPGRARMGEALGGHMLLWIPRDEVGGDTYWVRRTDGGVFVAVVDCTGHGVPGAFMTLIVNSLFERELDDACRDDPGRLLSKMNRAIKTALSQHGRTLSTGGRARSDDGIEGAVCFVNHRTRTLHLAGARGFVFVAGPDGVREFRGDRTGVGFVRVPEDQSFANRAVSLNGGETVYLSTDGFTDQIGGGKRLPFGRRRLRECLRELAGTPLPEQEERLRRIFETYRGREPQRDDATVLGFAAEAADDRQVA
ncbi:MAG: SpoIIE family protein phosphatase [Desulfovibrionaceae bacterium]|jgi:serine phosphatase RsbU (regulator of sigma subunit)|nr:SpoIIE family protein phosphatase [Desulfovibrionaceae bacterium]